LRARGARRPGQGGERQGQRQKDSIH
jgi:hypothetical protein